jgi:hypothetical protein
MPSARFVVLLAVLVPFLGQAQDSTAPGDSPLAPPPLVSAPQGTAPERPRSARLLTPEDEEAFPRVTRLGVEWSAALVGAVAGAYLGGVSGEHLNPMLDQRSYMGLGLVGGTLGMSIAVYGAGTLMDARGGFFSTLLGGMVGGALPALAYYSGLLTLRTPNEATLLGLLGLVGLAGPVVAYELSHAATPDPRLRLSRASTGPRVVPVLAASAEGGTLGLAGQF